MTPEAFKVMSILVLGTGTGMLSASFSPVITLIVVAAFAITSVTMYAGLLSRPRVLAEAGLSETITSNRMLFFLCWISFFLSITIPKSGKTVSSVPVTTANLCILCSFAAWGITMLFSKKRTSHIPLAHPMLVFIVYGVSNAVLGAFYHNPLKLVVIEFSAFFGFIPVYFLVCSVLHSRQRLTYLIRTLLISLFLVCLYGGLQLHIGFERVAVPGITEQHGMINYAEFGGRWNYIEGGRQKLYSTFQNGNIFGNHLATFLPLLGGIILAAQARWKKMLLSGLFIGVWYTLFLTYSRGALAGAIVGMFVLAVIAKKIQFRAAGIMIIVLIALFFFIRQNADRPEFARYNIRRISESPNQFSAGRVQRVKYGWSVFKNLSLSKKLLGIGLGGEIIVDNLYVYFLVKLGLVGIFIFGWMLYRFFSTFLQWRSNIADIALQSLMDGGIAGLAACLVHNIADVLWLFPPLSANFWFLAGITMSIGMIGSQNNNTRNNSQNNSKPARIRSAR